MAGAAMEIPGSPITPSAPPTRFPKNKIRILLLENVHQCAIDNFHKEGFYVETAVAISEEACCGRAMASHAGSRNARRDSGARQYPTVARRLVPTRVALVRPRLHRT
jgi:hypothetical protein